MQKYHTNYDVFKCRRFTLPVVAPVVSSILKGRGWAQGSHAAIGQVTGCQGPDFIAKTFLFSS
jgi:hypothetical protein